jgi:sarcosine oxidase/sarcosine oxidase/L-pipecolate oxidase
VKSTEGNIAAAEKALQQENVPYTTLTAAEIERQYKFTSLQPDYTGLFQADGASINLLATSQTLLRANRDLPTVKMESLTRVNAIAQSGSTFTVSTLNGDSFTTPKLVLVPGPYANGIFNMLGFQIEATYWNMTSAFYRITKPGIQYPTWFVFQPPIGDNGNEFYGFPEVSWNNPGYIRVASDFVIHPLQSVLQRTLIPNRQELEYTAAWVRNHMTGLDPAWQFASTCLVALSDIRNKELLIDFAPPYVPNNKNIVIYATGWAAKFVPLLGVILSQLALDGRTPFDISNFALGNVFFKSLESQGES